MTIIIQLRLNNAKLVDQRLVWIIQNVASQLVAHAVAIVEVVGREIRVAQLLADFGLERLDGVFQTGFFDMVANNQMSTRLSGFWMKTPATRRSLMVPSLPMRLTISLG